MTVNIPGSLDTSGQRCDVIVEKGELLSHHHRSRKFSGKHNSNFPAPPGPAYSRLAGTYVHLHVPPKTNVLFSTLYKLDQADGLWPRVFDEFSKVRKWNELVLL